jgi:hypothetical protein
VREGKGETTGFAEVVWHTTSARVLDPKKRLPPLQRRTKRTSSTSETMTGQRGQRSDPAPAPGAHHVHGRRMEHAAAAILEQNSDPVRVARLRQVRAERTAAHAAAACGLGEGARAHTLHA